MNMTKKWKRSKAERDAYYELARKKGLRSRAYFKLEDIDRRFSIFENGDWVIDLGAYPGGWLQYIVKKIGIDGMVIGVDIKPIKPFETIPNIQFVLGDVFDNETLTKIGNILNDKEIDIIVSDLSPSISGIWELDTETIYEYNRRVLDYADKFLKRNGKLVMKSFEGRYMKNIYSKLQKRFKIAKLYKPRASRKRSAEIYFVCMYYRPRVFKTSNNMLTGESVFKE